MIRTYRITFDLTCKDIELKDVPALFREQWNQTASTSEGDVAEFVEAHEITHIAGLSDIPF